MTETYSTHTTGNLPVPQQDAGYARPMMVAAHASCASTNTIRILRLPDVVARIGLCRASIYQHMAQGTFPKSVSIGVRAIGWLEHEIDAWLAARMNARK